MTDLKEGGFFLLEKEAVQRLIVNLLHLHTDACCVQSSVEDLLNLASTILGSEYRNSDGFCNCVENCEAGSIGGARLSTDTRVTAVQEEGRPYCTGRIESVGGSRKLEARPQEVQRDRLDLIEYMALGLTHELKQPLAAINAYLMVARKMLKERSPSPEEIENTLNKMGNQAFRISEIVENMRQFMVRGVNEMTLQHLNEVVRTACEFTDGLAADGGVSTTVRLGAEDDRVVINRVQIQQVLVNLKRNAIEAMQGRERREMAISTCLVEGGAIRVDVADTGPGLPEAVKAHLFAPFVTTKPHGLGVGLSISHWIIEEAHQGRMWADENPGGGTIFRFVLPLARS